MTLSSYSGECCNSVEAVNANDSSITVAPGESPISNVIASVDCARQKEDVFCCTSSSHPWPQNLLVVICVVYLYFNFF